jgi:hypothetical protein
MPDTLFEKRNAQEQNYIIDSAFACKSGRVPACHAPRAMREEKPAGIALFFFIPGCSRSGQPGGTSSLFYS